MLNDSKKFVFKKINFASLNFVGGLVFYMLKMLSCSAIV